MCESIEFRNLTPCAEDIPVFSLPEYYGEIWSPVEIDLHSSVDYDNPYVDTEIDAVFTHTDGATVTLPGFWKQERTWAVRFSPTREGDWSYKVTCKDTANAGLFAEGVIHVSAATRDTALSKHGFVTVEKGKSYYQYADGTPFFWLGDTNWQAFTNVSTTVCNYPGCSCGSQFKHIVNDRKEKGFSVYQTYFVPEAGNGERPLWLDEAHKRPDTAVFNDKVDEMFAYLHEQGMVVALGLGCHGSTMLRMKLEDFLRFTRYVVARYACYSIVWITGQEITDLGNSATPGYTVFDCYIKAAELVDALDGYKHPNSAHMYPMHATDERAQRLDTSAWHDSWTVQAGHGYVQPKAFYESYYTARGSGHAKPFIESEANYEDINCGFFTGYDLNRMGAWSAMLCGSAGFTYGTTGIWAGCFSTSVYTGWYGETSGYSYEPWYMGLDKLGSLEVGYMRRFFEAIGPWYELIPCFADKEKASMLDKEEWVMAATRDASVVVAYFRSSQSNTAGTVKCLDSDKRYTAYWFDPRTGRFQPVEENIRPAQGQYNVPDKPNRGDWVFLMTSLGLDAHYENGIPQDLNPDYALVAPTGSKVTPVSVKAIGGITYEGTPKESQIMTDHTLWLYDGDPSTVWTPSANRATQSFLFDLGTAHDLTHITITPEEGTIIPTFRVEGSNNGKLWHIITDTSVRQAANPGAGSEPLQGVYRYVRVFLRNADSVNVGADALDTLPYKAMYNPMTSGSYSVTRIVDISIYSNGAETPVVEELVPCTRG